MMKLNVGCGATLLEGWTNLDGPWNKAADVHFDLEQCPSRYFSHGLPFEDNTFDELLMIHVIEHIQNILPLMEELYRVAKPDAILGIRCPHGASDDADEDPTHVRRLYPRSFAAFGQPYYYKADYGYRGDWSCDSVTLAVRKQRFAGLAAADMARVLSTERNVVLEMITELRAEKPARARRDLQWPQIKLELIP